MNRREFLNRSLLAGATVPAVVKAVAPPSAKALIAITLDLEMSRHYPKRGMTEWDYQKGNLDEATKRYSVETGRIVKERGGLVHFFCVGRVLEQENVDWLIELAEAGHPIGNHTYDHVNVKALTALDTQYRFRRAPWLVEGKNVNEVMLENVTLTDAALKERIGIKANGFRTPGGFRNGLEDRPHVRKMLKEEGFSWISSKYPAHLRGEEGKEPDERVYDSIVEAQKASQPFAYDDGLIEIPMSPISDVNAFRTGRWKREWFLEAIRRSVEWAIDNGAVFDLIVHPSCMVVEDPEFETFKLIADLVSQAGGRAEIVGLDTIAKRIAAEAKAAP